MKDQVVQKETWEFHKSVENSVQNPPTHFSVHLLIMSVYLTAENLYDHEKLKLQRPDPETGNHNQFMP